MNCYIFYQIDDTPTGIEGNEFAQGPSTPGLEEPNLFNTQVTQVITEAENHNSADLVSMKSKVSTAQEEDAVDHSMQYNAKNHSVGGHEDTDCPLVDSKIEEQEHLTMFGVNKDQENLVENDHFLTSSPRVVSSNKKDPTSMVLQCTDGTISASGVPEKVEDLHDGIVINSEPVVVSRGVSVNETVASPSCSHVTSDVEDPCCKDLFHLDVSRGPESDGHLRDSHALSKHEILTDNEIANSEGESTLFVEAKVSNAVYLPGSPGRPEVVDVEAQASQEPKEAEALDHVADETVQPNELHLRPCTSHMSPPDVLSIGGKLCRFILV